MGDLVNTFSWSNSRASKFESCRRAYYFHYYGSWGGWESDAPERTRELWILKKLTGRQAWSGSGVHDAIASALRRARAGDPFPSLQEMIDALHQRMRQEFRDSRDGAYRRRKALGLVEHEYGLAIDDAEWKRNWEHAERCLRAFYEAPIRQEILETPSDRWLPIDDLASFDFEGTKVFVAPDFAFRDAEDHLRILDWKTGRRREKDREQVRGYALFAAATWGAAPQEIRAELHYLGEGTVEEVAVDPDALDAFRERLRASIAEMKAALVDPEANQAEEASFPPISERRVCRWCNFRKVCDAAVER